MGLCLASKGYVSLAKAMPRYQSRFFPMMRGKHRTNYRWLLEVERLRNYSGKVAVVEKGLAECFSGSDLMSDWHFDFSPL
jgi:hypothetical protein